MRETTANEIRLLIARNQELELRLGVLQRTIATIRADFDAAVSSHVHAAEPVTVRPAAAGTHRVD